MFTVATDSTDSSATSAMGETSGANAGNTGNSDVDMADRTVQQPQLPQPVQYNPFLRTRNIPFRIGGRRRSISVFSTLEPMETIYEAENDFFTFSVHYFHNFGAIIF